MGGRSSSSGRNQESMMADKNANTGHENKRKTVCDDSDDDKSGDKWLVPNGKKYEDRGGPGEVSGQDDMQSFDKSSRPPSDEDWDNYNTKSVEEYEDQRGKGEGSGQDGMQSSDKWSRPPSEEDCNIDSNESAGEYEDQRGKGEDSGQDDMQSSDKWRRPPSEEDCNIDSNESEYPQSDDRGNDEDSEQRDMQDSSGSSEEDWTNIRNKSVAGYAQSDEEGTDEDSVQEDMQDSPGLSEENRNNSSIESVAEYAQSDEGGTDEGSGHDDMQSSSDKWIPPSVEDYAIGFIQSDDVDKTLGHNPEWIENIRTVLSNKLTHLGPQKTADYIKQHLDRWKTEKVKFAVAGQCATGKSTFINIFRGIKEGQDGFADVGFGYETENISEYKHPVNENIIFCELPGLSITFTKRKFLKMVNLSEYNYIFILFGWFPNEDDAWLTVQIQEKGIPFCLVRSKVDKEIESSKGRQMGAKSVILKIRQTIKNHMAENTASAKAELFLISSEKPHIGEMSNLQDHIKEKLPSDLFSSVMLSLPILTEAVIEQKLLELKKRMPYVSIGTAILTTLSDIFIANQLNIALIKSEVRHYVKVFGLDQKYDERIEGLKNNFSEVSVDDFAERMLRRNYKILLPMLTMNDIDPIYNIFNAYYTKKFVDGLLSDILSELKQDAITVYMYLLNNGSR